MEECIDMAAEAIALSVEEYVKARKPTAGTLQA